MLFIIVLDMKFLAVFAVIALCTLAYGTPMKDEGKKTDAVSRDAGYRRPHCK